MSNRRLEANWSSGLVALMQLLGAGSVQELTEMMHLCIHLSYGFGFVVIVIIGFG